VSPVKYEQGFYIPEDDILRSDRRGDLKCLFTTRAGDCADGRSVQIHISQKPRCELLRGNPRRCGA
jgi:hypothetical protein